MLPVAPTTSTVMAGFYPHTRPRRLRQASFIRSLVRETRLSASQLIQPLFVAEGDLVGPVASMPGIVRLSPDQLAKECADHG